jgi:hypothetical protein
MSEHKDARLHSGAPVHQYAAGLLCIGLGLSGSGCANYQESFSGALRDGLRDANAPAHPLRIDVDASQVEALTDQDNECWARGESAKFIRSEVAAILTKDSNGAQWARVRVELNDVSLKNGLAALCAIYYPLPIVGVPCAWTTASASVNLQLQSGREYTGHGESNYVSGLYYNVGPCQRYGLSEGSAVAAALADALSKAGPELGGGAK